MTTRADLSAHLLRSVMGLCLFRGLTWSGGVTGLLCPRHRNDASAFPRPHHESRLGPFLSRPKPTRPTARGPCSLFAQVLC